jgi:hypothetical protein
MRLIALLCSELAAFANSVRTLPGGAASLGAITKAPSLKERACGQLSQNQVTAEQNSAVT